MFHWKSNILVTNYDDEQKSRDYFSHRTERDFYFPFLFLISEDSTFHTLSATYHLYFSQLIFFIDSHTFSRILAGDGAFHSRSRCPSKDESSVSSARAGSLRRAPACTVVEERFRSSERGHGCAIRPIGLNVFLALTGQSPVEQQTYGRTGARSRSNTLLSRHVYVHAGKVYSRRPAAAFTWHDKSNRLSWSIYVHTHAHTSTHSEFKRSRIIMATDSVRKVHRIVIQKHQGPW